MLKAFDIIRSVGARQGHLLWIGERSARHVVLPLKRIFHFRMDINVQYKLLSQGKIANFRTDLESGLALGMLRVVEVAAIVPPAGAGLPLYPRPWGLQWRSARYETSGRR